MQLAVQAEALPEVGYTVIQEARELDQEYHSIIEQMNNFLCKHSDFIENLKKDWTEEELVAAGF